MVPMVRSCYGFGDDATGNPMTPSASPRSTYFCVDIECAGPVPADFDMVSIGAVAVTQVDAGFMRSEPFYVEIQPQAPKVDARALAISGLTLDHLAAHGVPLSEALRALSDWVFAHIAPGTKPVFVGHNAPFDWSFINWSYHHVGQENPFGYKALDTKALAMGILGLHWFDSNKENLEQLLDLPPQDSARVHRADYDAWYQAEILVALFQRSPSCAD